jgi:hypothetical protein
MKPMNLLFRILLVVALSVWEFGCDRFEPGDSTPETSSAPVAPKQAIAHDPGEQHLTGLERAMEVQNRHTPGLMKNHNVLGTAVTINRAGKPAILILVRAAASSIPTEIDGTPTVVEVSDEFVSMGTRTSTTVSHTTKQIPPVQLGTSGGWTYDNANGYCCGGTLGALIVKNGVQYVLSNSHVLWGDIVLGNNNRIVAAGDPVIQPGLLDDGCNASNGQLVATVAGSASLPNANVDVGYAQVAAGMVRTDGSILEIGTISATTLPASLKQLVKKSGRTTALTHSSVSGINATLTVSYTSECYGSTYSKTFTGQILVNNPKTAFLQAGDSGSLLVEDVSTNPRAVGLLFASSTTTAVANPINDVLNYIGGATLVGK